MDFEMPDNQRREWDILKEAVNDYAETTGSEIAVVTSYKKCSEQVTNDGLFSSEHVPVLALHGHGSLLVQLQQCVQRMKWGRDRPQKIVSAKKFNNDRHPWHSVTAAKQEGEYHTQAVARSLSSSFQSLRLDQKVPVHMTGGRPDFPKKHGLQKVDTFNGEKRDVLELDENLLFEEQIPDTAEALGSDDDGEEYNDSDDGYAYGEIPNHDKIPQMPGVERRDQRSDHCKLGTSLPVNIDKNFALKPHGTSRINKVLHHHFPSSRFQHTHAEPHAKQPGMVHRGFEDTPNSDTMMASMQALAKSVTDNSTLIFGERPRPRLNTGEFRQLRDHR